MSMMMSFVLSFFPRDVLGEILNLIKSVSEGFPTYSSGEKIECVYMRRFGEYTSKKHNISVALDPHGMLK